MVGRCWGANLVLQRLFAVLCLLAVAGCGDPRDSFDSLTSKSNALTNQLLAMPVSSNASMSAMSGSATFIGYSQITINPASPITVLRGDARVDVKFGTGSVTGELTGFVGRDKSGNYDYYLGTIYLPVGWVGSVNPSDIDAFYTGTLDGNGDHLVFLGTLSGSFLGNPVAGLYMEDLGSQVGFSGYPVTNLPLADISVTAKR